MNRLCIATRGIGSWRARLANSDLQWERGASALEAAVSWESASASPSGLPTPIADLLQGSIYSEPVLAVAIAEHRVALSGSSSADSQCDVWALITSNVGAVSLSVEAKAKEPFGRKNEPLAAWLAAGTTDLAEANRRTRWDCIREHLPDDDGNDYSHVAYQLLHRCASAVIEAKRFRLKNAAFVVQAFQSPLDSFDRYSELCQAMRLKPERGRMHITSVGDVPLGIGWADCPLASDKQIAAIA